MANVKFDKKTFEKEIGKLNEKLLDRISMFGTPVESVTDEEIELEIFPNRPDLLSYHGFKRSFLAFLGKKTGLKQYKINPPEKNYQVIIDPSVKKIRPFTACAIIKGLKLDDAKIKELIEIQEKLHTTIGRKRKKLAIGIYPLEKITLPITYKALEPDKIKFVPLEFPRELSGLQILQKHPTGREYAHLLAGKVKFPIFIDAKNEVLSMPPIINSQLTGKIEENTKDVFVECSGENFEILKKCLNIIVTCLAEMGGKIYQMDLKYSKKETTPNLKPEKMKISLENTNKLLGLNLTDKQIKIFLERMGYNYNKGETSIAPWRIDILHEVDLIEDVAIAYGYENFVPEIPQISTIGQENKNEIAKRKISEILTGLNFLEISNYHLTTKRDQFTKMGIPEKQIKNCTEIKNSKTEYNILRNNLLHYTMKILSENVDAEYPQKIFEIGRVFDECKEKENLCFAIAPGNFTQVKQILEYLSRMISVEFELQEKENAKSHFIDGRVAKIMLDQKEIGIIGEVHPRTLGNWKIKMPVTICEIELEEILKKL